MKKRKSPIALITILAVMASVAFGLQYASSKGASPAEAPPAPPVTDVKPVGEARAPESKSSVLAGVKGAMTESASPAAESPKPMHPGMPSGPLILNPAAAMRKPEKPKPNSSSTSTQWYNHESALSDDKG